MMLGFRRDVDIIKSLVGPHPAQPETDCENQQEQADNDRQPQLMRGGRVKRRAIYNADACAQDHQRHAGAANHRQTVLRQLACLSRALAALFCHSKTAFNMIDSALAADFARHWKIRQD